MMMTKEEILCGCGGFLLDLDGTLYLGDRLIEGAVGALRRLREMGKRLVFLTNNSSKTEREYREKLTRLNLLAPRDEVYTSAMAAVSYLNEYFPAAKVYLLGTDALKKECSEGGICLTEEKPDVCLLAYDTQLTFEKIRKFDAFLKEGAYFIATHSDDVCPTDGFPMPDAGSFLALFERSSGRKPDVIVGKPYSAMGDGVARRLGIPKEKLCMIGDRMHTDIRFANQNGMRSILVLSGETTEKNINRYPDRPDLILPSIGGLFA